MACSRVNRANQTALIERIMFRRFRTIFVSRNKEFYRDRAAFGWNFLFPFLIILGFAILFQRGGRDQYKVGIIPPEAPAAVCENIPDAVRRVDVFQSVVVNDRQEGFIKLKRHKLDLLVECRSEPLKYWISETSPKGEISEGFLMVTLLRPEEIARHARKQTVSGRRIHYIDWLFPGIIAMNMMFSALFGVGYVVVRYRKNGVLKRFKATPLTAFEYLGAQVVSRMALLLMTNVIVYAGCALLFGFRSEGSYVDLVILFSLGCASIIALGLVIASRSSSEEFANGVLNFIAWPMMFLSEVWFSLEGAPGWIQKMSQILPLTHVTEGMRRIIIDGAGLTDLAYQIITLLGMTILFMLVGSVLFKWSDG